MNGNPICLAAGKAALEELEKPGTYEGLWANGEKLRTGLLQRLTAAGYAVVTSAGGPVFHLSFGTTQARTYRETLDADAAMYSDFGLALLDEGVMVLPDGRWYLSTAHSEADIDATLAAVDRVIRG